jgi:hypothetical protein
MGLHWLNKVKRGDPLRISGAAYNAFIDAAAKAPVKRPVAAYVERVHESGNFSWLGL